MQSTTCKDWTDIGRLALTVLYIPMQEVWPLMYTGGASTDLFHCPNDTLWRPRPEVKDAQGNLKPYGWTSGREFSYGIQFPYAGLSDGDKITLVNLAVPYGKKTQERLIVLADQNPGNSVGPGKAQHSNHPDIGCVALERGGSVVMYEKAVSSKAGMNQDDIYLDMVTAGTKAAKDGVCAADTIPDDVTDTSIVPQRMPRTK
jgi:hypothetical protein